MSERVKIAGVQMDVAMADKPANLERMAASIATAAAAGARLVVFPECALTGYCFETLEEAREQAEPVAGPASERLAEHCRQAQASCVYGMLERDGDRVFNACVLVGPDGVVGSYRKIHLPHLGVDRFATPGDRPFAVHSASGLRIGMNICYDASFPESARVMTLDEAELIVLPTNWPPGAECTAQYVINTRALENRVYYIAVNRIGTERGFRFIGGSRICGPDGEDLAMAGPASAEILYAEVDPSVARTKRIVRVEGKHEINRIRDRRPEFYGRLVE